MIELICLSDIYFFYYFLNFHQLIADVVLCAIYQYDIPICYLNHVVEIVDA